MQDTLNYKLRQSLLDSVFTNSLLVSVFFAKLYANTTAFVSCHCGSHASYNILQLVLYLPCFYNYPYNAGLFYSFCFFQKIVDRQYFSTVCHSWGWFILSLGYMYHSLENHALEFFGYITVFWHLKYRLGNQELCIWMYRLCSFIFGWFMSF